MIDRRSDEVGCGPTIACGLILSELVLGRSIAECWELTAEDLIEALDGVPPDKLHCPVLAIGAFWDALKHLENNEWRPVGTGGQRPR